MIAELIFLGCFLFGLVFTAASFFGGHLHLGHVHLGHLHAGGAHGPSSGRTSAGFNAFSAAAFLCWFGGIGYLLQRAGSLTLVVVVLLALLAGCAGASVVSLFLTRVLMRNERPMLPEDTEMRGVLARVSSRVRSGGTGEIVFTLNGTRRCSAARSLQQQHLQRGTEVVVLGYERGIAWVAPFHAEEGVSPPLQGAGAV